MPINVLPEGKMVTTWLFLNAKYSTSWSSRDVGMCVIDFKLLKKFFFEVVSISSLFLSLFTKPYSYSYSYLYYIYIYIHIYSNLYSYSFKFIFINKIKNLNIFY